MRNRKTSSASTSRSATRGLSVAELERLHRSRGSTPPLAASAGDSAIQEQRSASSARPSSHRSSPGSGAHSGTNGAPVSAAQGNGQGRSERQPQKKLERSGTLGKVFSSAAIFASQRFSTKAADAKFGPDLRLDEESLRRNGLSFAAAVAREYHEMVTSRRASLTKRADQKMRRQVHLLEFLEFDAFGRSIHRAISKQELVDELRLSAHAAVEGASPRRRQPLAERSTPLADALDLDVFHSAPRIAPDASDDVASKCEPVQLRDLRFMDPTFRSEQVLLVRENAIILVLDDHLRAIIQSHRLLLFNYNVDRVQRAVRLVTERLQCASLDIYNAFEFNVLESMFISAYLELEELYVAVEQQIEKHLQDLNRTVSSSKIENMRLQMRHLTLLMSRIKRLLRLFDRVLGEDDDMSNMYLTEKRYHPDTPRHPLDHEYVETLLESYYQLVQSLSNRAELLDQKVNDTESTMDIKLDAVQNRMLAFNVIQHLCTATFFAMNFVADIFGMNLNCPWYNITDTMAPWLVTVLGSTALGALFLGLSVFILSRRGLLFGLMSWRKRSVPSWSVAKNQLSVSS
ncbi:magnesium ion transporter [Cyanidiococcus yangmingshanensis]|uniref:Magnesium transporter n=1 Tax=Cyanidiococcus yangmingshanensis TaxID=2690220 RepID=A0A7J7IJ59_9RHOD|nr:magnesium ion transporter [Cyanidiococcus yangmingshanensis]